MKISNVAVAALDGRMLTEPDDRGHKLDVHAMRHTCDTLLNNRSGGTTTVRRRLHHILHQVPTKRIIAVVRSRSDSGRATDESVGERLKSTICEIG